MKFTVQKIKKIIREEIMKEVGSSGSSPSYTPKATKVTGNSSGNAVSSFTSGAIDATADSLWDNYWIPAKPIVKIARGLGIIDHVDLSDKKQIRETAQALQYIQEEGFKRIKESSMDWEKNFKWAKGSELKVIQFLIGMSHGGISDVLKDMKKSPSAFKSFVKDLAQKGLYEGFAGALKKGDRKKFDSIRRKQAEVLGYTLTGKDDIKTEIGDATIMEDLPGKSTKSPSAAPLIDLDRSGYKKHFEDKDDEENLKEGVADEIRKQIPRRTLSYVGAKNFAKGKSSKGEFLEFSVKGSRLKTGGKIKVIYNKGGDDYIIEAWQIRGTNVKLVKKQDRIQVDKLGRTIENLVG